MSEPLNLDALVGKLSQDPHAERTGREYLRHYDSANTAKLVDKLSEGSGERMKQHEAEAEAREQREADRRRLHPGQYDQMKGRRQQ